MNNAIEIYLELDAIEKMSVSVPCLGLAGTLCCTQVFFSNI